jgi:molecular chaperone GrpE
MLRKKKGEVMNEENTINNTNQPENNNVQPNIDTNNQINQEEIKKLNDKIADLENKLKYQQAELINYRKRKDEETSNMLKYANQDLILELIVIVDNFERAIKLDDSNLDDNLSKFLAGFKIIYSHLTETLKKFGVEEIETVGVEFDPNIHEALMTVQDHEKPNDIVTECLLKGYKLKGKVIRAAKVVVNKLD